MIRPTLQDEIALLVDITRQTGLFKPLEIEALREVFDDYFDSNQELGHHSITLEHGGEVWGFAYYAPAAMTDRTWQLYWIVVRKDAQAPAWAPSYCAMWRRTFASSTPVSFSSKPVLCPTTS